MSADWEGVHTCHAECPCQTGGEPPPDFLPDSADSVPWIEQTAPGRTPPRVCVHYAKDALERSYGMTGRAPLPLLAEAVDWLRRAIEQMADYEVDRDAKYQDVRKRPDAT